MVREAVVGARRRIRRPLPYGAPARARSRSKRSMGWLKGRSNVASSDVPSRSVQSPPTSGSGSLPGSKRNVVLHPLSHAPDLLDQVGEVAAVLDEIDLRAVDHEKWGLRVVVEEVAKRLREPFEIFRSDRPFVVPIALLDPAQEHLRPGLEIDDQVGAGSLCVEQSIDLLVERQLVGVEVDRGEDVVLREQVVGDGTLAPHALARESLLLSIALQQEEELRLERVGASILV